MSDASPSISSTGASPSAAPAILVVDDESDVRLALEMTLKYEDFEVWTAKGAKEALARLDEEESRGQQAALVITDLKMPGMDGLELLEALSERPGSLPVIMISGHGDVATAVEAVQRGASDFLEKPLDANRTLVSIRNALARGRLESENRGLRRELGQRFGVVGESQPWLDLMSKVERAALVEVPVLITGENGTGKEVVARRLHLASARAEGPFIPVNCAAIPEELFESELFGHEKGAFTGAVERRIGHFEAAGGGTLFLDEIGDMPLSSQAKLLRALETREVTRVGSTKSMPVDIRVLAATNADLAAAVEDKSFRMDLFYRLNVVPLRLPPLRERRDDIPLLAEHFLDSLARRQGRGPIELAPEARALLVTLEYPGNVRQLRNLLEGAYVLTEEGQPIGREVLDQILADGPSMATAAGDDSSASSGLNPGGHSPFDAETFEAFKNDSEALFFRRKLELNEGNIKRTAENLGMQRSHLYKKLDRYGLR